MAFALSLPLAAYVATRWFVPLYRSTNDISAYAYLERRFGVWARLYAATFYLLTQLARMGTIMFLVALALEIIEEEIGADGFDQIVGCELAGVPFAAIVADRLEVPLVVALKQAKGFGRLAQCEGEFAPDTRTLLIDDVTTDGRTKATFREALERASARVVAIFVFLNYRIFPGAPEIISLMTLADIVAVAERDGRFEAGILREVREFAENAPGWSGRNGGIGKP